MNYRSLLSMCFLVMLILIKQCIARVDKVTEPPNKEWYGLPVQHFVVKVDKVFENGYSLALLAPKKNPYILDETSKEYAQKMFKETDSISRFFEAHVKGTIIVYNMPKGEIIYKLLIPTDVSYEKSLHKEYFGLNDTNWEGLTLPSVKIADTGTYAVRSELYSDSNEYKDLMLAFKPITGTK